MNLARTFALVALTGLGTVLYGCGSDNNAGTGSTGFDQPGGGGTGTASGLIDALCNASQVCCVKEGSDSSKEACVAFYKAFTAGAKVGPTAAACEQLIRQRSADGSFCEQGTDDANGADICDGALELSGKGNTPKQKPGDTCDTESDCSVNTAGADAYCAYSSSGGAQTSTCVEVLTAAAGEPCLYTLTVEGYRSQTFSGSGTTDPVPTSVGQCRYADKLYCDSQSKTCKPIGAVGEACTGFDSCTAEANCEFDSATSKQICKAKAALGEACNGSSNACVKGTGCKDKVCSALLPNGSACTLSSECANSICNNSKCSGGSSKSLCFSAN